MGYCVLEECDCPSASQVDGPFKHSFPTSVSVNMGLEGI